jgi:hypothetical protein
MLSDLALDRSDLRTLIDATRSPSRVQTHESHRGDCSSSPVGPIWEIPSKSLILSGRFSTRLEKKPFLINADKTDSDSENLGSNPSSPATDSVDEAAIFATLFVLEQSEKSERTAHIGRTEVGTVWSIANKGGNLPPRNVHGGINEAFHDLARAKKWSKPTRSGKSARQNKSNVS